MTDAVHLESAPNRSLAIGDVAALVGSIAILIGYAFFPLRSDGAATGLAFINSGTTFPALTLMVGVVGAVSALVSLAAIRERAVRWWFVGLGMLGLIFLVISLQVCIARPQMALASNSSLCFQTYLMIFSLLILLMSLDKESIYWDQIYTTTMEWR